MNNATAVISFTTLCEREIMRLLSVFKQTIVPPLISSFLYIFIFGFSLGRSIQTVEGLPYLTFLIPGLVMMYLIEGSFVNTSSSLFIARWQNHIQEVLLSPMSYVEMVFAFVIGGLVRGLVASGGVYLISLMFVRFPIEHPLLVSYFIVVVSLTFSSVGLLAGLVAEEWEHIAIWNTFVITPLIFFGGVFHSLTMVPHLLRMITAFNPIFYMVNGLRYSMLGVTDAPLWLCMMVVLALFVGLFSLTVLLFQRGYKLRV